MTMSPAGFRAVLICDAAGAVLSAVDPPTALGSDATGWESGGAGCAKLGAAGSAAASAAYEISFTDLRTREREIWFDAYKPMIHYHWMNGS